MSNLYKSGMNPVMRIDPTRQAWHPVPKDCLSHEVSFSSQYSKENGFNIMIRYHARAPHNPNAKIYFAFTYPFSYEDCCKHFTSMES